MTVNVYSGLYRRANRPHERTTYAASTEDGSGGANKGGGSADPAARKQPAMTRAAAIRRA